MIIGRKSSNNDLSLYACGMIVSPRVKEDSRKPCLWGYAELGYTSGINRIDPHPHPQ